MNFSEYQIAAMKTATYPQRGDNIVYPALGLAGETGEVVEKIKKYYRNTGNISGCEMYSVEERAAISKELGDVLWYIAAICDELDLDMDKIALDNLGKLKDRQQRNVIKGEGDNR